MIDLASIKKFSCFLETQIEGNPNFQFTMDSRELDKTKAFICFKGERHNSLSFVKDQLDKMKAFIYEDSLENEKLMTELYDSKAWIKVSNSLLFLQELGAAISQRIIDRGGEVIAISGSNGKTTTKEMLSHLLSATQLEVITTQKNNNNHIGVPLTLLQATPTTDVAVVEFGSNHPGEIALLCESATPSVGICTNIGASHLEFFQTLDNVFKEEAYVFEWMQLRGSGLFFLNQDDPYLSTLKAERCITYGESSGDYQFEMKENLLELRSSGTSYKVANPHITGKHNLHNMGAALAVALELFPGHSGDFLAATQTFVPTPNRSQWLKRGSVKIFLDAYNANPSSMKSALSAFSEQGVEKTLVVIGDMNELGDSAPEYHQELGELVSKMNFSKIVFIGRYAPSFILGAQSSVESYSRAEDFQKSFLEELPRYERVFIKGSRSLQLEQLLDIT